MSTLNIISFDNQTAKDRKLLKRFVDFHWDLYHDDPQYIPLLDYEYLGFKLLGIKGFFEPINLFYKHAEIKFFLALRDGQVVGRCDAFINHNHNKHWNDRVGFFGNFESIDDPEVTQELLSQAAAWLKSKGMTAIRGPQNFPVNEVTPGIMTSGFDSRPVVYYHYNKPYYEKLLRGAGFEPVKSVLSWEAPVMKPIEEKLDRVARKVIERYGVTFETWSQRPLIERKREMFEIYNEAWTDNWGFVPFNQDEFYAIVDDMQLIMEKKLFLFAYINNEPVAFFGGILNIFEHMKPWRICRRCELIRAIRMLLGTRNIKGFRTGYLGVKKKYRRLGLDGVLLWKQKQYTQSKKYVYSDLGWVLDTNVLVHRLVEMVGGKQTKVYTIFQKAI
jgi:hypothetical protein